MNQPEGQAIPHAKKGADDNHVTDRYYIVLVSIHGLIRGENLELGRDADTGGQTKYVVELARALGECPEVERVDLLTRQVIDDSVSDDYAQPLEQLSENVRIVRIACGEQGYIAKEKLWDSLESFADNTLNWLHEQPRLPDIIHSHYADAGYVGTILASHLGTPLVHTGHSLGRGKRMRLLASGVKRTEIETTYNMSRRIEAEEATLGVAERVITSTSQEIREQYALYDYYQPEQMRVVPPGTDLEKLHPPCGDEINTSIAAELNRFFRTPHKPMILALSRPDARKNIVTLIEAYGESEALQEMANLVIVAGNRDDIRELDSGAQDVLTDILLAIDLYDLYGRVAYPKHHSADEVALIYRLAALSGGVFINPALTEPFGLTLIEAAASGLPIVATEDGGPVDIIGHCHNGYLIDPLDKEGMAATLQKLLSDTDNWRKLADNGLQGVRKHYSWQAHAQGYLNVIRPLIQKREPLQRMQLSRRRELYRDRAIFTDLDQNLMGDRESLNRLLELMHRHRKHISFGIATGRRLDSAMKVMRQYGIPQPDVLITSQGTEIHYAPNLTQDRVWTKHINHQWNRSAVSEALSEVPGLLLQPKAEQHRFKLSYFMDPAIAPDVQQIRQLLSQQEQAVNVVFSFGQYLDILPVRASKGFALRWVAEQFDIPLENILAAGGSGADEDMMRGNTRAVVVANRHDEELSELSEIEHIYFAQESFAAGIIEAMDYYDFFGEES
ncbi:MAG: HAD family hydrolase [Zetaproteobacteria bacterium CG1_02_53_45]|nr:MAG: HAD family hydrolase [Zetaproteobacteria bacterium CG1_02_53_45]